MPRLPSPTALTATMSKVDQVRAQLPADSPNELVLGMIEGETTAIEDLDSYLEAIVAAEVLAEQAKARADRWTKTAEELRQTVANMMDKMGQTTMVRPIATLSMVAGSPKVHIPDEDAVPLQFQRLSPDKVAIGKMLKLGHQVDWATLNNSPPTLRITK